MTDDQTTVVNLRMPTALVQRAKDLAPALTGTEAISTAGKPTTAAVLRLAISRGLAELEKEAAKMKAKR